MENDHGRKISTRDSGRELKKSKGFESEFYTDGLLRYAWKTGIMKKNLNENMKQRMKHERRII